MNHIVGNICILIEQKDIVGFLFKGITHSYIVCLTKTEILCLGKNDHFRIVGTNEVECAIS